MDVRDVIERNFRCLLPPHWEVHHLNHDYNDNRIDNLVLLTRDEHVAVHSGNGNRKKRHYDSGVQSDAQKEELQKRMQEVIRLYKRGYSLYSTGLRTGFGVPSVRKFLVDSGITIRTVSESLRIKKNKQVLEEIITFLEE